MQEQQIVGTNGSRAPAGPLLRALRGERLDRAPIWLMRQAGRYLPEYRALRAEAGSFLELCYTPHLAREITLQPVRRFGLDAAILFSDILVVADALGCQVSFVEGAGPRLEPVRGAADLARLRPAALGEHLAPVYETVTLLRRELAPATALIGFAGAPWTVAAYMVEGEGSKEFAIARRLARRDSQTFRRLIDLLTEATIDHLAAQVEAGADVVQLFDSWAGILPEPEFVRWCLEPTARIARGLKERHPNVPLIVFPRGAGWHCRALLDAAAPDALGLDTGVAIGAVRAALPNVCLQGNLDPVALLAGGPELLREAGRIASVLGRGPFIFNLGHGVLPETDPASVAALVEHVRSLPLPHA
jgi:uroporphyrinogen decarboxylase